MCSPHVQMSKQDLERTWKFHSLSMQNHRCNLSCFQHWGVHKGKETDLIKCSCTLFTTILAVTYFAPEEVHLLVAFLSKSWSFPCSCEDSVFLQILFPEANYSFLKLLLFWYFSSTSSTTMSNQHLQDYFMLCSLSQHNMQLHSE